MNRRPILLAAVALCALPGGALAQTAGAVETVTPLVVQALPFGRSLAEVTTPVIEMSGEELIFQRRATLGDTLAGQPGIHSDTFGGGASRPVIRGQSGPRVTILSDSSEILDASRISPDHAVTVEPLLIDKIEVLRGPSALLYGGGAIGGAVNLIDSKIPTAAPSNGFAGVLELRAGTNAKERAGVAGITAGAGPLVFRAEGALRSSDDYSAGRSFGRVPGTYNDTGTGSIGASLVGPNGYLGLAYTREERKYGVPGHDHEYEDCHPHGSSLHCGGHDHHDHGHDHDHDDDHDEPPPFIDLWSDRFDLRGEVRNPFAGVERIRLRAGATNYRHDEVDDGDIATTFRNKGWDGRVEVTHSPIAGWRGVVGVQTLKSDFSALGDEAFLPPNETRNTGVFIFEEYTAGPLRFELAARQEWQRITPQSTAPSRKHSPFSLSGGAIWTAAPGYSLALSVARSQRAPSAQELYARGVHLATNTYERGTNTLGKETSNAVDLTFRKTAGDTTFTLGAFVNRMDDYIYAETLDQYEEFRLIRYSQADARFAGLDGKLTQRLSDNFSFAVFGDYVRGKLTGGGGDLPRIPSGRLGGHLDFRQGPLSADLEYFHVFRQSRIADFEDETPGYDMVNLTLAYDIPVGGSAGQIYLRAANLLDQLAFNHTSFVKAAAPLMGRTVTLGLRARF